MQAKFFRENGLVLVLGVLVLSFYLYGVRESFSYPFQFDDYRGIVHSRAIRYLEHPRIFGENINSRGRLLTNFSFALNYYWSGLSLSSFRIWNIVIHLLNATLVGFLFFRWTDKKLQALVAAAFFLMHPIAIDTSVYLFARSSLLVLFFILLALCFQGVRRPTFFSWLGFLGCSVFAFLSKENAVVVIFAIILIQRMLGHRLLDTVSYLAPLCLGGLYLLLQKAHFLEGAWKGFFRIQGEVNIHSLGDLARVQLSLWPRIVSFLFRPDLLSIDHHVVLPLHWMDRGVLLGVLCVVFFLFSTFMGIFYKSAPFAFLALFFWAQSPTNSIFLVPDPLAERQIYVALPAIAWFLAWSLRKSAWLQYGFLALSLSMFSFFSLPRLQIWQSAASLWQDAYTKEPKFRSAYNLAYALLMEQNQPEKALRLITNEMQRIGVGTLPYEEQELAVHLAIGAIRNLPKTIEWQSIVADGFWKEYIALQLTLGQKEFWPLWQQAWNKYSTQVLPGKRDPGALRNILKLIVAEQWKREGDRQKAIENILFVFSSFKETHFPYWTVQETLGDLYWEVGDKEKALEWYTIVSEQYKVYKRFPRHVLMRMYQIHLELGDRTRAKDAMGELLRVYTDDPEIRERYAELLFDHKNAARHMREAKYYKNYGKQGFQEKDVIRP